jgi:hypothetical protein
MRYSADKLDDISHNRDRLKAYFWRTAMNQKRLTAECRRASRAMARRILTGLAVEQPSVVSLPKEMRYVLR